MLARHRHVHTLPSHMFSMRCHTGPLWPSSRLPNRTHLLAQMPLPAMEVILVCVDDEDSTPPRVPMRLSANLITRSRTYWLPRILHIGSSCGSAMHNQEKV